ncbi:hypothetical protein LTR62_007445 [Meristemomyces frigidus]|uniref:Uncharacterized protein n=1 Tax=Meristemomyces frigidus TaxID=1508187 RepID=A0AAN7TNK1_9PEZI|nr:hypothetical protein LTR62_007445 [Meristemomyces frigidus]
MDPYTQRRYQAARASPKSDRGVFGGYDHLWEQDDDIAAQQAKWKQAKEKAKKKKKERSGLRARFDAFLRPDKKACSAEQEVRGVYHLLPVFSYANGVQAAQRLSAKAQFHASLMQEARPERRMLQHRDEVHYFDLNAPPPRVGNQVFYGRQLAAVMEEPDEAEAAAAPILKRRSRNWLRNKSLPPTPKYGSLESMRSKFCEEDQPDPQIRLPSGSMPPERARNLHRVQARRELKLAEDEEDEDAENLTPGHVLRDSAQDLPEQICFDPTKLNAEIYARSLRRSANVSQETLRREAVSTSGACGFYGLLVAHQQRRLREQQTFTRFQDGVPLIEQVTDNMRGPTFPVDGLRDVVHTNSHVMGRSYDDTDEPLSHRASRLNLRRFGHDADRPDGRWVDVPQLSRAKHLMVEKEMRGSRSMPLLKPQSPTHPAQRIGTGRYGFSGRDLAPHAAPEDHAYAASAPSPTPLRSSRSCSWTPSSPASWISTISSSEQESRTPPSCLDPRRTTSTGFYVTNPSPLSSSSSSGGSRSMRSLASTAASFHTARSDRPNTGMGTNTAILRQHNYHLNQVLRYRRSTCNLRTGEAVAAYMAQQARLPAPLGAHSRPGPRHSGPGHFTRWEGGARSGGTSPLASATSSSATDEGERGDGYLMSGALGQHSEGRNSSSEVNVRRLELQTAVCISSEALDLNEDVRTPRSGSGQGSGSVTAVSHVGSGSGSSAFTGDGCPEGVERCRRVKRRMSIS